MTTSHQQEQDERQRLLGSTNQTTTYREIASRDLNLESGGRYAQPSHVVGSTPIPQYPSASGPWSGGDNLVEPPTGIDINAQEPTGTVEEINASISALELAAASATDASDVTSLASAVGEVTGDGKPTPAIGFPDNNDNSVRLPSELPSGLPSPTNPPSTPVIKRRKGL